MDFSIVIPVYNNQNSLEKTYKNIVSCFSSFNYKYQIVFVDDCSNDSGFNILFELKKNDNAIVILQLDKNYGQSVAVYAGLKHATGRYVTVISADLQEEETFIEKLITTTQKFPEADLIIGYRSKNSDYLIFKILSRLFYKIIRFKIPQMPHGGFDTAMGSFELKEKFTQNYYEGIFIQVALLQLAQKVQCVEYHRKKSAGDAIRIQSIYFKFMYFILCIRSVYIVNKKKNILSKEKIYSVKNYLP